MRKVVLLSSVVVVGWVFSEFGETGEALAQCVATTDCASLGYTESSCPNGGIKCPFGSGWSCKENGTGSSGGNVCEVGWVLYSDKTCSSVENRDISKTPIGVVSYKNPNGGGIAMGLEFMPLGYYTFYPCSGTACDTFCKKNEASLIKASTMAEAVLDVDSCSNTQRLKNLGYGIQDVLNYSTPGTSPGDWCLPAAGVLWMILQNKETIDATLKKIGIDFGWMAGVNYGPRFVSSTNTSCEMVWGLYYNTLGGGGTHLLPVLTF